ncbi:MAG: UPF0104 family protein [Rhizobiaceae bacterium]|nr:UPF0104 family protein [Rhizobiaceae bacterium]
MGPTATAGTSRRRRVIQYAIAAVAVALALFLLYRTLSRYEPGELVTAVGAVSVAQIVMALAFAAASYGTLTLFDWLALRYAGRPLPWRQAALASFCSLSLGHNIGFAALSSGAIRYRFYSRWGLRPVDVARVILFCALTVGIGLITLAGLALTFGPQIGADLTGFSPSAVRGVGVLCLAVSAGYAGLAYLADGKTLSLRGHVLEMPRLSMALAQIAAGTLNFAFVAAALHQAVISVAEVPYLEVAAVYVSANVATLITHAPGGLGVIESVVVFLLPQASMIGAVLVFRFVYYLVPLALGGAVFLASELLAPRLFGVADSR